MSDKRRDDVMGEVFAQDRLPVPRRDPRDSAEALRQDLYHFPAGTLSRDAGVADLGKWRYGRRGNLDFDYEASRGESARSLYEISKMINPERFGDAVTRMPLSQAPTEYEKSYLDQLPAATFDERFRGM